MGKPAVQYRSGRHCLFLLHCHFVFVTKYRGRVFEKRHIEALEVIFRKVCEDFEVDLAQFDGEADHVHLLVNYPPKVSLSRLVNSLKGVSSRHMRRQFPELVSSYFKGALWSRSYFAGSVGGAPLEVLRQYIESQATPADSAPYILSMNGDVLRG